MLVLLMILFDIVLFWVKFYIVYYYDGYIFWRILEFLLFLRRKKFGECYIIVMNGLYINYNEIMNILFMIG